MAIKQTKDSICCVVDSGGSYVSMAVRLAKDFKHVYYCNPSWIDAYPLINKAYIGEGIDEIESIDDPWQVYDKIDVWFFPDCYYGNFAEWLSSQGEAVWGSKLGEELELDRSAMKDHLKELGLPVNPWKLFTKFEDLKSYLKSNDNVYVKINKWRGTIESFYSKNYKLVQPELEEIEYKLGALKNDIEFIVEQPIDEQPIDDAVEAVEVVEVGYDGWTINSQYPETCLSGVEIKDKAYVGIVKPYKEISPLITTFNTKMIDTFKGYEYAGFFSTELRVKGKVSTLIDFTARIPCPPGDLYFNINNLGDVINAGAHGELVEPDFNFVYGAELLMESEWSEHNFQPIYFDPKYKDLVHIKKHLVRDEIDYIIPQAYPSSDIGSVTGFGDTLEAAIKQCLDVADSIEGSGITIRKDALDDAQTELDKMNKL
jgi:hypothetical protein